MDNTTQIFSLALGLEKPWFIEKTEFNSAEQQLDIYLNFTRGHKFTIDDGSSRTAHDTLSRPWQHLNFFQHKCFLHAKVPRVKQSNGKVKLESVPWGKVWQWFYAFI
jgi:transposase